MNGFKKGQIVVITNHYKNGNKSRLVGVISSLKDPDERRRQYATLVPLPESNAALIRKKYLTSDFNYQGMKNCYSDRYGFACHHISKETTVVIGEYKFPRVARPWYPQPGNTGFDLMC